MCVLWIRLPDCRTSFLSPHRWGGLAVSTSRRFGKGIQWSELAVAGRTQAVSVCMSLPAGLAHVLHRA